MFIINIGTLGKSKRKKICRIYWFRILRMVDDRGGLQYDHIKQKSTGAASNLVWLGIRVVLCQIFNKASSLWGGGIRGCAEIASPPRDRNTNKALDDILQHIYC